MATSRWTLWGIVLGFALGGFFDGILLHQILQWHHLLSLVPGIDDLRMQVVWDGYFHALMYAIAALGLWGLWRAQRQGSAPRRGEIVGALLVGIGVWHITDSILSHWLLGIHRIKVNSPNPLAWDLAWFAVFGIVPVLAGWRMLRGGGPGLRRGRGLAAMLALSLVTAGAGAWAMRPAPGQPLTAVVFRPGIAPAAIEAALAAADARQVWADPAGGVVVVDMNPAGRWGLYRRGAMLVSGAGIPPGCFAWSRA